jgi:hypothetical protein
MGDVRPLHIANAAPSGVHVPVLAAKAFPDPEGTCTKGIWVASCQSGRLKYPCNKHDYVFNCFQAIHQKLHLDVHTSKMCNPKKRSFNNKSTLALKNLRSNE